MTGAVITLAVALVLAIAGLVTMSLKALSAERGRGDARADEAGLAAQNVTLSKDLDRESARADSEKERADALDAAIAKFAADAVGSIDGSHERLLEAVAAIRANVPSRGGSDPVRDAGSPQASTGTEHREGDSDLLEPGA